MNQPFLLPAPYWLLSLLSYLTLSIHFIFMNLTFGGSVLCAIYLFKGKEKHLIIAQAMAHRLPYFMAFAITFGIAPLLFVQTLYSGLFYTSAIYLSAWFLIIPLNVFLAYALLYALSRYWTSLKKTKPFLYLAVVLLMGSVLFIYNNLFSMIENSKDPGYLGFDKSEGYVFHFQFMPALGRFLHFFFASIAISGLWVAVWGILKLNREPEQGRWQYRSGATWFSAATILAIATGIWWLVEIPHDAMMIVMGKSIFFTVLFFLLIISSLAALVFALLGMNSIKPSAFLKMSAILTIFNVIDMVVLRDAFRQSQMKGFFNLSALKSHFQWEAFLTFLAFLLIVLYVCYDLAMRVRASGIKK
jgi:hypothetical protein